MRAHPEANAAATSREGPYRPLPHGPWMWLRLRRALLVMTALCTVIALFITAFSSKGSFASNAVYSFAIGFSCWLFTDGARLLIEYLRQRRRQRAGLPLLAADEIVSWRVLVPLIVLGTAIGLPMGLSIGDTLSGGSSVGLLRGDSPVTRVTLAITVVAALFMTFAMSTLERLANARINAEAARAQASQLQLKLLQSQLEPHMLFNTLANLRVLIALDSTRAQAMLDHLIAFLRATLNASRGEQHALAIEFARVGEYLALMGYRMGPRLVVRLQLPDALREVMVPPLILQPLVENAIRHGLEPKVEGGELRVSAERDGLRLKLVVRDTGIGLVAAATGSAQANGTNFGLQQVRERLRTLHGDAAQLTLSDAAATPADPHGGTLAIIELPMP